MTASILSFPKIHKHAFSDHDIEQYISARTKLAHLAHKSKMLLDAMDGRLFDGAHDREGPLSRLSYQKLMAFYNAPSQQTWDEIQGMAILDYVTCWDVWIHSDRETCYKILEGEGMPVISFPSRDSFMLYYAAKKLYIIEKNNEYIDLYKNQIDMLEKMNPGMKEEIERRLRY